MNDLTDDMIRDANLWLKDMEMAFLSRFSEPEKPVFFIVGAPRSGTTLILQTIINHFDIAYINNMVAKFWDAPVTGAAFYTAIRNLKKPVSYESRGGFTDEIDGPHEFGYFWKRFFLYGETHALTEDDHKKIDIITLKREIAGLEKIFGRPMVFKNPAALSLQIDFLARHIPNSCFIYVRREPFFIAQSLYQKRIEILNDAGTWYSVKPASFPQLKDRSPVEQVAGQVMDTIRKMETDIAALSRKRVTVFDYESFCSDPARTLGQYDLLMKYVSPEQQEELRKRSFRVNNQVTLEPGVAEDLKKALSEYK
jgi:hypothetical protein